MVVLAVMVGIGILSIPQTRRVRINEGLDNISEVLFAFINLVMKLAPIGTFGAVAYSVGSNGSAVLVALAQLVLSFYAVVLLFIVVVMGLIAKLAGFSLWRFLRFIKDEILIVLGTASSESALPRLLIKLERLGCAKQTVGLVLPTGYAFNLDGTSLFMAMGVMFISHAYNVPLTLDHQIGILLLMLLTSKGAATVSGGSFVVFAATVTSTGMLPSRGWRSSSVSIASCRWPSPPATPSATASPPWWSPSGRAPSIQRSPSAICIRSAIPPRRSMPRWPTATCCPRMPTMRIRMPPARRWAGRPDEHHPHRTRRLRTRSRSRPTATGARRRSARGASSTSATSVSRPALIRAFGLQKIAAARANRRCGALDADLAEAIVARGRTCATAASTTTSRSRSGRPAPARRPT